MFFESFLMATLHIKRTFQRRLELAQLKSFEGQNFEEKKVSSKFLFSPLIIQLIETLTPPRNLNENPVGALKQKKNLD